MTETAPTLQEMGTDREAFWAMGIDSLVQLANLHWYLISKNFNNYYSISLIVFMYCMNYVYILYQSYYKYSILLLL